MSYQDDRLNQIQAEIQHLTNIRRQLRNREKSLDARLQNIPQPSQFQFNNIKQFRANMGEFLPQYMMPVNVGGINEIAWPFFFQIPFDATLILPNLSQTSILKGSFQIDQEAAFVLMSITRSHDTDAAGNSATLDAPIQVDLIDRQSSRRFQTGPVPIQQFGFNSNPAILPTGMLLYPNAFLDVNVTGVPLVPQDWSQAGSPTFALSFFGYRTRIENADKVLSTIFG